jgi:hypothetical protein
VDQLNHTIGEEKESVRLRTKLPDLQPAQNVRRAASALISPLKADLVLCDSVLRAKGKRVILVGYEFLA